ncbi:hypothetical protein REPUB_Repub13aG0184700 [Reevesia pubescens]
MAAAAKSTKRKIPRSFADNNADSVGKAPKTNLDLELKKTVVKQSKHENNDDDSCLEEKKKKKKVLKLMGFQDMTEEELKNKISLLKTMATDFKPKSVACWTNGEKVPFLFLCQVFDLISQELGRNNVNIACNLFRTIMQTTPGDLLAVVHLSANKIALKHEVGSDLGVGETLMIKALAEAFGTTENCIKDQYKVLGDLGKIAETIRPSQTMMFKPQPLTVSKVFEKLLLIAKKSGRKSKKKKMDLIKSLVIAAAGGCEVKYIVRLLTPKIGTRIGFAESTLLEALGQAAVYNENPTPELEPFHSQLQEAAKIVKQAFSVCPVYDKLIRAILKGGIWDLLRTCCFSVGLPVEPMLAKPVGSVSEIVKRFDGVEYACEYKYDGERAQIHYKEDGRVEIYTRNLEPSTEKFPDVVIAVSRLKKPFVKSFVLDCEIVACDRDKQELLPFQILSTRRRKNVAVNDIKVQVCIFAFDMLYLNGHSLNQEQLKIRKQHLYESFVEEPGFLQFATAITWGNQNQEEIEKFLDAAISVSCEGLVIKGLDGTYEPAMYSCNWLKLKKDYMEGIGDSLDLVPIAAYYGRGKRTGAYGAFLLACYHSGNAEFQSICKLDAGFSKKILTEVSSRLSSKMIPKPKPYYRYVGDKVKPDVWFEPSEVWEVKAGCLTISPVYCAAIGIVEPDKGLSVRFPSLIRVRKDKEPEQASSSELIAEMYHKQFAKPIK